MARQGCRGGRATAFGALLVALGTAAPAVAATRYAEPSGNGPAASCPEADPCDLETAVEDASVNDGDEIVVLPGTHPLGAGELSAADRIEIHGAAGQPRPLITGSAFNLLTLGAAESRAHDLELSHSGAGTALFMPGAQSVAERVVARNTSSIGVACYAPRDGVLRDSVCRNTGGGSGIRMSTGGAVTRSFRVVNVTALASGGAGGRALEVSAVAGAELTLDATNVIADGPTDVVAATGAGTDIATVNLDHSNYDTHAELGPNTTVTAPGTGTNQTAAPLLADPAAGDVHQLAGSPTIDAGAVVAELGSFDIDGEARTIGALPDIGADESAPPDLDPPQTRVTKAPERRTFKRKAKLRFDADEADSSFECDLDGKGFVPCESPFRKRVKRGRHRFEVRATDAAGNTDPTPAVARWKVRKRR